LKCAGTLTSLNVFPDDLACGDRKMGIVFKRKISNAALFAAVCFWLRIERIKRKAYAKAKLKNNDSKAMALIHRLVSFFIVYGISKEQD